MVHISTDDVFDGKSDQPYNEFDQTRPQTAYGKSKLAGEQYVKNLLISILLLEVHGSMVWEIILLMIY